MDFHNMKRRDLQSLCKKHDLPAGGTNLDMVDRLESYLKKPEVSRPSKKVRFSFEEEESKSNDLKNSSEGGGVQRRSSMKPGSEKTTQVVPGRMTRSRRGAEVAMLPSSPLGRKRAKIGVEVEGSDGGEKKGARKGKELVVENKETAVEEKDEGEKKEILTRPRRGVVPDLDLVGMRRNRRGRKDVSAVNNVAGVGKSCKDGGEEDGGTTRSLRNREVVSKGDDVNPSDEEDVVQIPDFEPSKRSRKRGYEHVSDTHVVKEDSVKDLKPQGRATRQLKRGDNAVVSDVEKPKGRATRQSRRTASTNEDAVVVDGKKKSVAKGKIESQIVNEEFSSAVEPEGRATRISTRNASTSDAPVVVDRKNKSVAKGKIESQIVNEEFSSAVELEGRATRISKRNASTSDAPVRVDRKNKSVAKGKFTAPEKETQYVTGESKDVVEPEGRATRKSKRDASTSDDVVVPDGKRKSVGKGKVAPSDKETQVVNEESNDVKKFEGRDARKQKKNASTDDPAVDGNNKPWISQMVAPPDKKTELVNEESKIVPKLGKVTRRSKGNALTNQCSSPSDGKSGTKGVVQKDASVAFDPVTAPENAVQLIEGESKLEQTPRSSRRRTVQAVEDMVPLDVPSGSIGKQKLGQSISRAEEFPKTSHIKDSKRKSIVSTNVTAEQPVSKSGQDNKEAESVALTNVELSTGMVGSKIKMQKQKATEIVTTESPVSMTSPTSEVSWRSTRGASKGKSMASDFGVGIIVPNTFGGETPIEKQQVTEIVIAESYVRKTSPISERSRRSTRGSSRREFVASDSVLEVVVQDIVEAETPVQKKKTVVTGGSDGHKPQDKKSSAKGRRGKSVSKQAEQKRHTQEEVDIFKLELTDSIIKQDLGCIKEVPNDVCQSVVKTQSFEALATGEDLLVTEKENSQVGIENHPLLEGNKFDSIAGSLIEENISATIDSSAVGKESMLSTSTCLEEINITSVGKPSALQEVHAEKASNVDRSALETFAMAREICETAQELVVQDEEELQISEETTIGSAGGSRLVGNLNAADISEELLWNAGDGARDITAGDKDNALTLLEEARYQEKVEDKGNALNLPEEVSYQEKKEQINDYVLSFDVDHAKNDELAEVPSINKPSSTQHDTGDGQFFEETSQQSAECSLANFPGHIGRCETDPFDSGKEGSIYLAKSDMSYNEFKAVETEEILVGSSEFLVEASSKKQTTQYISEIQDEYGDQETNISPIHDYEDVDETSAVVQREENTEEKTVEALHEDYEPDVGNINVTPYEVAEKKEASRHMVEKLGIEHDGEAAAVMIRDSLGFCRESVTGIDHREYSSSVKSISSGSNQECDYSEAQEREDEPFEHKEEAMMGKNSDVGDVEIVSEGLTPENLKDEVKAAPSSEMIELENDADVITEEVDAVGLQQIEADMGEDADLLQHFSNDFADLKNDAVPETPDNVNSVLDEQISDLVFVASPGNVSDHEEVGTSGNLVFEDRDFAHKREDRDMYHDEVGTSVNLVSEDRDFVHKREDSDMHQSHREHIDGFAQGEPVSFDHEDVKSVAEEDNIGASSFSESYNLNFSEGEDISRGKASLEPGNIEGDECNLGIFDSNERTAEVESHEKTSEVDLNTSTFQDTRQCKETADSCSFVNKEVIEGLERLDSKGGSLGKISAYEISLEEDAETYPEDFVAEKEETAKQDSDLDEATHAVSDEKNCGNVASVNVEEEEVKQDIKEEECGNQAGNRDISAQVNRFDDSDSDESDEETCRAIDENNFDNPESVFVEEANLKTISREGTDDGTSQDILLEQDDQKNHMAQEDEEAVGFHFNEGECENPSGDIENQPELENLEEASPEIGDARHLDSSDVQLDSAAMVQGDEVSRNNSVAYGFTAWEIDILSEDNTAQGDATPTHMDGRDFGEPIEDKEMSAAVPESNVEVDERIDQAQSVTMYSEVANADTSLQYVPLELGNTEVEESDMLSFGVSDQIVESNLIVEDSEVVGCETISQSARIDNGTHKELVTETLLGVIEVENNEDANVVKAVGPELDHEMISNYEEMQEDTQTNFDDDVSASEEIVTGNSPMVAPEEHCPGSSLHGTHTGIDNVWKEETSFISGDSPQQRCHHGAKIVLGQVDCYSGFGESMSTEEYVDQKHIEAGVSASQKDKSSNRLDDPGVNTMITQVDQFSEFEASMSTAKYLDQDHVTTRSG